MKTERWHQITKFWESISTGSVNRKIFSAAIIVAGGTVLVKAFAVVKELIVAAQFGTADELDAFLIALIIPSVIINVIADSFNSALIPTYIKVREQEGKQAAQKLFSGATIGSVGLLLITTFLLIFGSPFYLPYITSGFSAKKLDLTYQLLWTVSPIILFSGVNSIWHAILNAGERFVLIALTPILTPAVTIIALLTMKDLGVFNLPIGMVLGQLLEMTIIGRALHCQGISLVPKWHGFDNNLRQIANQYLPMMGAAFFMTSSGLIDQAMAAMLPSGSISALGYGEKIITLPIVIANTALSAAVIPYCSKMFAQNDWQGLRRLLKSYLGLIFAASVPFAGLIIVFSEQIVRILLQRGSFTAENTHLVAQIQACFALQIPFYIGCILVVRLSSTLRMGNVLMWGSVANMIVNVSLNYLLMQWWGVAGIALSTSFVYLFSFLFLLFFLIKNLRALELRDLIADSARAETASQELL
jgi:putative peptidoglycan lipid II flippase